MNRRVKENGRPGSSVERNVKVADTSGGNRGNWVWRTRETGIRLLRVFAAFARRSSTVSHLPALFSTASLLSHEFSLLHRAENSRCLIEFELSNYHKEARRIRACVVVSLFS